MNLIKLLTLFSLTFIFAACNSCSSSTIIAHTNNNISEVSDIIGYNVIIAGPDMQMRCGGTLLDIQNNSINVLTASHCVLNKDNSIIGYGFIKDGEKLERFEVIKINRYHDLAFLRITNKNYLPKRKARLAMTAPFTGDIVWIIGFGAGIEDVVTKGIVSKVNQPNWTGVPNTLLDATAFYGNSGGGVFNAAHELVGVIIQIGPGGPRDGWIFAVRLEDIYSFLKNK